MALVRSLFQRFMQNKRKAQEEHDVWKLYHLLFYHQQSGGCEVQISRPPDVAYHEQYRSVHSLVTQQLITRLRYALDTQSGTSPPACTADSAPDDAGRDNISPPLLHRCASPQSETITGVRLSGRVVAGTVLCFFPGTVYLPTDLGDMPGFPDIGRDHPHLMSRTDGSVIDAKPYTHCGGGGDGGVLADGHMIRHPKEGQEANVMPFSYNVEPAFPQDLLPLIPNRYYRYPGLLYHSRSPMRTIVFVATRHIRDEELLLNYRLHPDSQLPSWYTSPNTEEDRQRWNY